MGRYERFYHDVNRAYTNGIVCPVQSKYYAKEGDKELACALTAAYMVNTDPLKWELIDSGGDIDLELKNEILIREWALKFYRFTDNDLDSIIAGFDYPGKNFNGVEKRSKDIAEILSKKWFRE